MRAFRQILICALLLFGLLNSAVPQRASAQDSISSLADPGPHASGWRDVATISRSGGGTFNAIVYYPAALPGGLNAAVDPTGAPYPAITFGHGFQQGVATYSSMLRHLASWGFIVVAPRSYENSLVPNHSTFANDLRDGLTYLELQNALASSPLYQAVDVMRFGVMGHSMGGGASLIAADRDPRILAVATMAAAETNPSAITAMTGITRPVQLIGGSQDTIVPPSTTQTLQYAAGHAPKQAPLILGGFHCGYQDYSEFAAFCDTGMLARDQQRAIMRRLLTAWFLLYLRSETGRWLEVWGPTARDAAQPQFKGDDGIVLAPRTQAGRVAVGMPITYTFALTNTGPLTNMFALAVESSLTPSLSLTQTPLLAPNTRLTFTLAVSSPVAAIDALTVTARSLFDGGTTDWANISTTVTGIFTSTAFVRLPVVLRDAP